MLDKIRKQKIGSKEYNFKMTNKTIRKIDDKYGNYGTVIYGIAQAEKYYTNALKLVSMCCIDKEKVLTDKDKGIYEERQKEWDIEELEDILTGPQYQEITELAWNLYIDYMGANKKEDKKGKNEKEKN